MLFYATFTTGFHEVASDVLKKWDRDIEIIRLLDGAVLFKRQQYKRLPPCFHNVFEVLLIWKKSNQSIDFLMRDWLKANPDISKAKGSKSFRIVTSVENNLVSVNKTL